MDERSDYDRHMDALAVRIGTAIGDGTPVVDAINACAAVIGCALSDLPAGRRDAVLQATVEFIKKCCAEKVAHDWLMGRE